MKKTLFFVCFFATFNALCQNVTITPGGITPAQSGTYPRISYGAILALPSPVVGDQAYDLTFGCMRVYTGTRWVCTYQAPSSSLPNLAPLASTTNTPFNYSLGTKIATDGSGNIYVAGNFNDTTKFAGTTLTSVGDYDIFIAKYNKTGTLQWVRTAGGLGTDAVTFIAVDASANVYITGGFSSSGTFGTTTLTSTGNNDIFIAKYNTSGVLQWANKAGGTADDVGQSIALDASSNLYVTGSFQGSATFGATPKTSTGGNDIFLAKYNSSGVFQSVVTAGGSLDDAGSSVAIDGSGKILIGGNFTSATASFGTINVNSEGSSDAFLAKYNPTTAQWEWVRAGGGTADDFCTSIAIDSESNIYSTGYLSSISTSFPGLVSSSNGEQDIYIVKYNSAGTPLWGMSGGGSGNDNSNNIAIDANNNLYLIGSFTSSTFSFLGKSTQRLGSSNTFIVKMAGFGNILWLQSISGVGLTDLNGGSGICVDTNFNVYTTGVFFGANSFGNTVKTTGTNVFDMYLMMLDK